MLTVVQGNANVLGECSWCLQVVTHTRTKACTMSRDVFQCGACNNRTLRCIGTGCSRMARGGVLWDNGAHPNLRLYVVLDNAESNKPLRQDYVCAVIRLPTRIVQSLLSWRRLG